MTAADRDNRQDCEALPAAYAAWRQSTLGQITDALEQDLILEAVGSPTGLHILDVGCGDGVLTVELSRRGAQAVGVDASERMIAAARKRADRHGNHVFFEIAKAEAMPFETGSFDVVVAVAVLCVVENADVALKEMARVLKPGGRLIVGELGRRSTWAAVRRVKGWLGSLIWRQARFRSASELRRLANGAGLVDASVAGAIFYPPFAIAARLLGPVDRRIGAWTTVGAAFLALSAYKPQQARTDDEVGIAPSCG